MTRLKRLRKPEFMLHLTFTLRREPGLLITSVKYCDNGVSPPGLLKAALLPTIIVWLCFFIFK
jgi:hypothetical protein